MTEALEILAVRRIKLWYDINEIFFRLFIALLIALLVFLFIRLEVDVYLFILPVIISLFLFQMLRMRYGRWMKNYQVTGVVLLSEKEIWVVIGEKESVYEIDKLVRIGCKHEFYQNYTPYKGLTCSGIGYLEIKYSANNIVKYDFLLLNKQEYNKLTNYVKLWKQNGLSVWE